MSPDVRGHREAFLVHLGRLSRRVIPVRGRARLQRAVQVLLYPHGTVPAALKVDIEGVAWRLDLRELVQFRLFWDGVHDGHVLGWLVRQARRRAAPVIWDVGANVGSLALPLARSTGARVEAFEPSPVIFSKLHNHVRLNPACLVRVHQVALGDRDGTVPFYPSAEPGNAGLGSLAPAHNTQVRPVDVRMARGDTLVSGREARPPDVIKIDVEGFEPEALAGLAATLGECRPVLCVESSAYRLDGRGLPRTAIVDALTALGYRISVIDVGRERPLRAADLATNFDLAAYPL